MLKTSGFFRRQAGVTVVLRGHRRFRRRHAQQGFRFLPAQAGIGDRHAVLHLRAFAGIGCLPPSR